MQKTSTKGKKAVQKKKPNIVTFDSLYPCRLYVSHEKHLAEIQETFYFYSRIEDLGNDEYRFSTLPKKTGIAYTVLVKEKKTGITGALVVIDNDADVDSIAHESVHVADAFFDLMGAYTQGWDDSNEPYAYLVGWIAGNIDIYCKKYLKK